MKTVKKVCRQKLLRGFWPCCVCAEDTFGQESAVFYENPSFWSLSNQIQPEFGEIKLVQGWLLSANGLGASKMPTICLKQGIKIKILFYFEEIDWSGNMKKNTTEMLVPGKS